MESITALTTSIHQVPKSLTNDNNNGVHSSKNTSHSVGLVINSSKNPSNSVDPVINSSKSPSNSVDPVINTSFSTVAHSYARMIAAEAEQQAILKSLQKSSIRNGQLQTQLNETLQTLKILHQERKY